MYDLLIYNQILNNLNNPKKSAFYQLEIIQTGFARLHDLLIYNQILNNLNNHKNLRSINSKLSKQSLKYCINLALS
jgi:hypothetical protein